MSDVRNQKVSGLVLVFLAGTGRHWVGVKLTPNKSLSSVFLVLSCPWFLPLGGTGIRGF